MSLVTVYSKIGAELFSAIDQSIESYPINIIDVIQPPLKKAMQYQDGMSFGPYIAKGVIVLQ